MNAAIDDNIDSHTVRPAAKPRRRALWWVLLIALALAVAVAARLESLALYANWGVVVPGKIYRSAQISRFLLRYKLQANHIGTIIQLSNSPQNANTRYEQNLAGKIGVKILCFPMNGDGVAEPAMYPAALAALRDANQRGEAVLIHCSSGAQRSGGVVATYRLLIEGRPAPEIYAEMCRYGFDPHRNPALLPFLNEHMPQWAQELLKQKVIERIPDPVPKITPP